MTKTRYLEEDELREQLAAIEHQRWADWQKWVHAIYYKDPQGFEQHIERWNIQIDTPYNKLSRKEQLSDLEQVDRYWQLVKNRDGRTIVAGKTIEFSHTAVNGDMHLFIDGVHDPNVCPECIRPGILTKTESGDVS